MKRTDVIAWLEARAHRDADTGCLVWRGAVNSDGHPVASVDGVRARAVRRWLYEQLAEPIEGDMKVVPKCRNLRCLEHTHQRLLLPGQVNALIAAEGRFSTPARLAANQKAAHARSKFGPECAELARQLRAQDLTLREISEATGLSRSMASRICRGEAWRPTLQAASVFSWGGAS